MNNMLLMGNRGRRNGVSVFGARNAQRIRTFVADVPEYSHISLLNCIGRRVPCNPVWHRRSFIIPRIFPSLPRSPFPSPFVMLRTFLHPSYINTKICDLREMVLLSFPSLASLLPRRIYRISWLSPAWPGHRDYQGHWHGRVTQFLGVRLTFKPGCQ